MPKRTFKAPSAPTTREPILPVDVKWELRALGPGKWAQEFYAT